MKTKKTKQILLVLGVVTLFLGLFSFGIVAYAYVDIKPLDLFYSQNNIYAADFSPSAAIVLANQSQLFTSTLRYSSGAAIDTTAFLSSGHSLSYTWFLDSNSVPLTGSSGFLFVGSPGVYHIRVQILVDGNPIICYGTLTVTNPDGSLPSGLTPTSIPTATPTPSFLSLIQNNVLTRALIVESASIFTGIGTISLLISRRVKPS